MVISLAGEWDIYRLDELRGRLRPARKARQAVLDLTSARYVTTTLIGELVSVHKERAAAGLPRLALAVQSAFVRRLLTATGMQDLFPICDSVADALTAAHAPRSGYRPPTPAGEPRPVGRS